MAPGNMDILIRRGDPWELTFSADVDGVFEPIDPTKVLAQIRDTPDGTVIVDLAINITVTPAPITGQDIGTLSLSATETAALAPGCYVWDLQPDVDGETWLAGEAEITFDVSKPLIP